MSSVLVKASPAIGRRRLLIKHGLYCVCLASFWTFGKFNCRSPLEGGGGSRSQIRSFFRPPGRRVHDSAEEVLDSLERELTLIESDDEPFVRAATGRNVVPRTNAGEPIVVQSDSLATVPTSPRTLQGVARCEVPDVAPPSASIATTSHMGRPGLG